MCCGVCLQLSFVQRKVSGIRVGEPIVDLDDFILTC